MKRLIVVLLTLSALLSASGAGAEIYRWTDADGGVHFSDRPASGQKASRVTLSPINSYHGVRVEELPESVYSRRPRWQAPDVVMFSAEWCGICRKAKAFFAEKGIPYQDRDIERDPAARQEFDAIGGSGVPLILVGDSRMSGFSAEQFLHLYER